MASCKRCGTNVGCSCKLVDGLCIDCRNPDVQKKEQSIQTPTPTEIKQENNNDVYYSPQYL